MENAVDDDWVIVNAPRVNVLDTCKEAGYKLWRSYNKVLIVYRLYRIIKVCIKIFILYHTLMPNHFPPF